MLSFTKVLVSLNEKFVINQCQPFSLRPKRSSAYFSHGLWSLHCYPFPGPNGSLSSWSHHLNGSGRSTLLSKSMSLFYFHCVVIETIFRGQCIVVEDGSICLTSPLYCILLSRCPAQDFTITMLWLHVGYACWYQICLEKGKTAAGKVLYLSV